ncbi:MAG: phage protease [Limisphaerales bacterium]
MNTDFFFTGTNEFSLDGEWLRITPYGDFPNRVGLQRIQKPDADVMVTAFNSLKGRVARLWRGLPVFVGHPDVQPSQYPDKRRHGRINDLQAREDGLYGLVEWNSLGKEVIDQGYFQYASPVWYMRKDGAAVRPAELLSVGLTNSPNIPGDPWAKNDDEPSPSTSTEGSTMDLKKMALLLGLNEAATALEIETALIAQRGRVTELETDRTTAINERDQALGQVTALTTERDTVKGHLTAANEATATERKARIERELTLGISTGRIKEADRVAWNEKLTTGFDAALTELQGLKVAVNTGNQVAGLGARKKELGASQAKILAINDAVGELMRDKKLPYHEAYQEVRKAKPELFG